MAQRASGQGAVVSRLSQLFSSFQVEKRANASRTLQVVTPFASVVFAMLLGAVPLIFLGVNPFQAYGKMFQGAFGSLNNLAEVGVKATPLLFTGLAVAIPLRAGLWNIGAEGQLYIGAFGAAGVALAFLGAGGSPSPWLVIPLMIVAGGLCAGLFALVPAWLKAKLGTNEIITTLMLNYVALNWNQFFIHGPWKDHVGFPRTERFGAYAWFPRFFGTRLHLGLFIALAMVVLIYFIYAKTRIGYETKVVGANPNAATLGGISKAKITLWTMTLAGAMAGLAGVGEVAAIQHRLIAGISPQLNPYGYTGIAVALLAKGNPLGLIPSALTFAVIFVGGEFMKQINFVSMFSGNLVQVPSAIVQIVQVLVIFSILAGDFLAQHRLTWRRHG